MATFTFNDGIGTVVASGPKFAPNFPALTGNTLEDTQNAIRATRLAVLLAGPKLTYTVHGHNYQWTDYMRYLDDAANNIARERARDEPFEMIGIGF